MTMSKIRFFFLCFFFSVLFYGCSCSNSPNSRFRLGIDPTWSPLDFGAQQPYVNGFTEELLIDMAAYNGIEFERVEANWDSLLDGMQNKKYDAVLSSLPPYNFHVAQYDFSENFLNLGSVLIVPVGSSHVDLAQMQGELVGVLLGDSASLQMQKYPNVILRNYESIPDLLDSLVEGEIGGALLDRLSAVRYIRGLYEGKLMIARSLMDKEGLRLIALKGKQDALVKIFNKSLRVFKKKKKLEALLKKWELGYGKTT